jgi:hypothetical protein
MAGFAVTTEAPEWASLDIRPLSPWKAEQLLVKETQTYHVSYVVGIAEFGGEGGIRTLDTGFGPYNGLAKRSPSPVSSVLNRLGQ